MIAHSEAPQGNRQHRRRVPMRAWALLGVLGALAVGAFLLWPRPPEPAPLVTELAPTPIAMAGTPLPEHPAVISPENAGKVVQLARWGEGWPTNVVYSPNGSWLAVASSSGIGVYNSQTMALTWFIESPDEVRAMAVSPSGKEVAASFKNHNTRNDMWLWHAGGSTRLLKAGDLVEQIAFSQDDSVLVSVQAAGPVALWRVSDGARLGTVGDKASDVESAALSTAGAILAVAPRSDNLQLWHMPDAAPLPSVEGQSGSYDYLAVSRDGRLLAAEGGANVSLWRIGESKPLHLLDIGQERLFITAIAISPDNAFVAAATGEGQVRVWSTSDGKLLQQLADYTGEVSSIGFSEDSSTLAATIKDGDAFLWRVADGSRLPLEGAATGGQSLTFSPDGRTMAGVQDSGEVREWSMQNGKTLHSVAWHGGGITGVAFSADGSSLSETLEDGTQRSRQTANGMKETDAKDYEMGGIGEVFDPNGAFLGWDTDKGAPLLWRLADPSTQALLTDRVQWIAGLLSPDGKTLASPDFDKQGGRVFLRRVSDGTLLQSIKVGGPVFDLAFSPNSQTLVTVSGKDKADLWRVSDGTLQHTFDMGELAGQATSLAFSPDGEVLAVGVGFDVAAIQLYRVSDGTLVRRIATQLKEVFRLVFSPDGSLLASAANQDTTVKLWRASDGTPVATLEGHKGQVQSLAFSPDGAVLASGGQDGTVSLWRMADKKPERLLDAAIDAVWHVAFSPDGATLSVMLSSGAVQHWRRADGALLNTVASPTVWISSVASPDGTTRVSVTSRGTILVWKASDSPAARILEDYQVDTLWNYFLSRDGSLLAAASTDGTVRIWKLADGSLVRTLKPSADKPIPVDKLVFAPDGAGVALVLRNGKVQQWRISDGSLMRTFTDTVGSDEVVGNNNTKSIAFSPDGKLLATGMFDATVKLWRVSDGSLLNTLKGHSIYRVRGLAFSPDGKLLASGGFEDGTVRIWGVR